MKGMMNAAIFGAALLAAPLPGCDRINRAVDGGLSGTHGKPRSMVYKSNREEAKTAPKVRNTKVEFRIWFEKGGMEIQDVKVFPEKNQR